MRNYEMEEFLMHYGVKGMRWKKHKYQAIKNGRYTYPNNMSNTLATGKTALGESREKRDAIVSDAAEKKNSVNVASLKEKQEISKLDAQLRALRESSRFKWTDIVNKGPSAVEKALMLLKANGIAADKKTKMRLGILAQEGKLDWLSTNPAVRDAYYQRKKEATLDRFGAGPNTLPNKNAKVRNSLNKNDNFVSRGLDALNEAQKNKKFFKKKGW